MVNDGLSVLNPHIVTTEQGAIDVAYRLEQETKMALDIEATSLYFREARTHGVAIATPSDEWYITYGTHPAFYRAAHSLGLFANKWWFMHNAAYDIPFIRRYIPNVRVKVFDTMLAQHTIDENQYLGLKPLAYTKLGAPKNLPDFSELQKEAARMNDQRGHKHMMVTDMPFSLLAAYAMRDVNYTLKLGEVSVNELREVGMWDVYMNYVLPVLPLILEMEDAGVYIDKRKLEEIRTEYTQTLQELEDKWNIVTNNTNPRSSQQKQELLYGKLGLPVIKETRSGQPATDAHTIKRLIDRENITDPDHPLSLFVAISKYTTLVNVIETVAYSIDPDTGRVYSKYNQIGAKTGRQSSSGVKDAAGNTRGTNAQNVPSHSKEAKQVRMTWAAAPGNVMGVWDYSQLELRISAHYMASFVYRLKEKGLTHYQQKAEKYSRNNLRLEIPEPQLIQAFLKDLDPHRMTANAIFLDSLPPEELTEEIIKKFRDIAKTINFGTLYGMGPRKFMEAVEMATGERIKQKEAIEWLQGFGVAFPEYPIWRDAVIMYCRKLGYVETIAKRRRRLPDINSRNYGDKSRAERQAVNAIIQGSGADIMNYANLEVLNLIRSTPFFDGVRCIGQVHDELAIEGSPEQIYKIAEPVQKIMVDAGKHFGITTPLKVDGGIGSNWTEAK